MSIWEHILRQFSELSEAFLAMLLATAGDLLRQYQHQERGGKRVDRYDLLFGLVRGGLLGVIAYSLSDWLNSNFGVTRLLGAALGGVLGLLGPGVIASVYQRALDRFLPEPKGKDKGDDS